MSHEGVLYCKPHHKELFQPKVVKSDIIDVENPTQSQEAIMRHQEQQRRMETIIRENNPVSVCIGCVFSSLRWNTHYIQYVSFDSLLRKEDTYGLFYPSWNTCTNVMVYRYYRLAMCLAACY